MHIHDQKNELRDAITARIKKMSIEERHAEGRSVSKRLLEMIPKGSNICGYYPLKTEVDIRPLLLSILNRGDKVFLPRFERKRLIYRQVFDLQDLSPGALTIPEPSVDNPIADFSEISHIIIPGRAFDKDCYRMGRGNGGYDIWISKNRTRFPDLQLIGVALECQIFNSIPIEPHDEIMDAVITARHTYSVQGM